MNMLFAARKSSPNIGRNLQTALLPSLSLVQYRMASKQLSILYIQGYRTFGIDTLDFPFLLLVQSTLYSPLLRYLKF